MKQIVQCFLTKRFTGDTFVAPVEIGGRWEQFQECFLLITASKWCPTGRVMSQKRFPEKVAYLGNIFVLRNSCLSMGSCQKLYILCLFNTSFVYTKERKTCGRFEVKAPRAYACMLILGLCQFRSGRELCKG